NSPISRPEPVDAALEHELDPRRLEVLPQRGDHPWQAVRADVRPRIDQDLGRRPVGDEHVQHRLDRPPLLRTRVELAVAERPRPTFAEAVVAVRIEDTVAGERREVASPRANGSTALEDATADP